jgi:DnaJ-class molecular chaperone
MDTKAVCPTCKGAKTVKVKTAAGEAERPCPACGGKGTAGPRTK